MESCYTVLGPFCGRVFTSYKSCFLANSQATSAQSLQIPPILFTTLINRQTLISKPAPHYSCMTIHHLKQRARNLKPGGFPHWFFMVYISSRTRTPYSFGFTSQLRYVIWFYLNHHEVYTNYQVCGGGGMKLQFKIEVAVLPIALLFDSYTALLPKETLTNGQHYYTLRSNNKLKKTH